VQGCKVLPGADGVREKIKMGSAEGATLCRGSRAGARPGEIFGTKGRPPAGVVLCRAADRSPDGRTPGVSRYLWPLQTWGFALGRF